MEMKATRTGLFAILLVATTLLLAIGCSEDDGITSPDISELFGTWAQSAVTINGVAADLADVFDWSETTVGVHITFNTDSTYSVNEFDASDSTLYFESGTITIDGSHIIVTTTSENGTAVTPYVSTDGTWAVTGDSLTVSATVEGAEMVLTLTRVN